MQFLPIGDGRKGLFFEKYIFECQRAGRQEKPLPVGKCPSVFRVLHAGLASAHLRLEQLAHAPLVLVVMPFVPVGEARRFILAMGCVETNIGFVVMMGYDRKSKYRHACQKQEEKSNRFSEQVHHALFFTVKMQGKSKP